VAHWYALHVRSNFERRVQDALSEFAYENFSPHHALKSRFGKGGVLQRPLLPGYVFARLELDDETRRDHIQVLRITGVVRVIGFGDQPEPIPDQEIQSLQILLASGAPTEPAPYVPHSGQEIEIICGPLTGCFGRVMRRRGKVRVTVSVEMLGKSVSAEVDARWLKPAKGKSPGNA
jgi:transcription antitermination factor NusG